MQNEDIRRVNRENLRDIREIKLDRSLDDEEKRREFIRQIGNPCLYRQGEYIVSLRFEDTDVTLTERLKDYIEYGQEAFDRTFLSGYDDCRRREDPEGEGMKCQ